MQTAMKPESMTFDEINEKSQNFTIKVKVIEKSRVKESLDKSKSFQTIYLLDEKGNKMKLTLFNNQISTYEQAIEYNGEYEISNLRVKAIENMYRNPNDDFPLQLLITKDTRIQPVDPESGKVQPQYCVLGAIPQYDTPDVKYDVLGVILYVQPEPRLVDTPYSRQTYVRDIVITDQTLDQPLTIGAWNDMAGSECEEINKWAESFEVVGFTALKLSTTKAFALSTSMSSRFIKKPKGVKADILREWVAQNKELLIDRQAKILEVRLSPSKDSVLTIEELKKKKARSVIFEERHWIIAVIPDPTFDSLRTYIGCSDCNIKTYAVEGQSFVCSSKICRGKRATAVIKCAFNFDAADHTGKLSFSTFNYISEQILQKTTEEIRAMKAANDISEFSIIQQRLQTVPMRLKLGPSSFLLRSEAIEWQIKAVEHNNNEDDGLRKRGMSSSSEIVDSSILCSQIPAAGVINEATQSGNNQTHGQSQTPDSRVVSKGKDKMYSDDIQKFTVSPEKSVTESINEEKHCTKPAEYDQPIQTLTPDSIERDIKQLSGSAKVNVKFISETPGLPTTPVQVIEKRKTTPTTRVSARKQLRFQSPIRQSNEEEFNIRESTTVMINADQQKSSNNTPTES